MLDSRGTVGTRPTVWSARHRGVIPGDLGDQRAAGGGWRHVLRAAAGDCRRWRLSRGAPGLRIAWQIDRRHRCSRVRRRRSTNRQEQGRSARHAAGGPRRARPAGPDRLLLLQQLPRRRVHGPDGRVRAVADVGASLGSALGCPERRLHHRRAGGRQDGPGQEPAAPAAAGQSSCSGA